MKNPYEILEQKETELARTRHEIECLRITASLLNEETNSENQNSGSEGSTDATLQSELESKGTGTEGLFSSFVSRPRLWGVLKRGGSRR